MADYQKISEVLIENAEDYSSAKFLNEDEMFDSIKQLCESPKGSLAFLDATSKVRNQKTKNKLIAFLKWACDKANSDANGKNAIIESIKPIMLTSVGFFVAMILGLVHDRPVLDLFNSGLIGGMIGVAFLSSIALYYYTKKRDSELDISIRSKSLIEIAQME